MKPLLLSKEQKEKLLEMTKTLFPLFAGESTQFISENESIFLGISFWEDETKKRVLPTIHWFEFCYTSLIEKLNEDFEKWEEMPPYVMNVYPLAQGYWNNYTKFHFYYPKNNHIEHPVDFLYKLFETRLN
jgi:hypothetical protein